MTEPQDRPDFPRYGRPDHASDNPPGERPQDRPGPDQPLQDQPLQDRPGYSSTPYARPASGRPPYGPSGDQRGYQRPGGPQAPFVPPAPYGDPRSGGPSYGGNPPVQQSFGSPAGYPAPAGQPAYGPPPPGYGPPPPGYGPPPPGYGYGYPAGFGYPLQRKTNGLAIAALVMGIAGILFGIVAPVAIGLGIAALVQLRRRGERGTPQAVIGLVLGSLEVVFFGGLLVLGLVFHGSYDDAGGADDGGRQPAPTSSRSPDVATVYVDDLLVGECFDDAAEEGEVERIACTELHDAEVVAEPMLAAGPYPGNNRIGHLSDDACEKAFTTYVGIGPDKSRYDLELWQPDSSTWASGDRQVICVAYGPDGDRLDGSVKGTRR